MWVEHTPSELLTAQMCVASRQSEILLYILLRDKIRFTGSALSYGFEIERCEKMNYFVSKQNSMIMKILIIPR